MNNQPKITIITGHYGAGKTNFAVNLALFARKTTGESVTVADLDIVNPYFRTADFRTLFADTGIRLAVSDFANSALDVPSVNLNIRGELARTERLIIDVGGDGEGAKALGRFAPEISEIGYEMYYVINRYRHLTAEDESAKTAVEIMRGIEKASQLKCTKLFNNSNLGQETTPELIRESQSFAEEIARITELPVFKPDFPVEVYVKPIWII
ncbi:MAG: cobalamin biosynthesis protein CobQ [Oscillospiraceae bacterium]|nr:cobalamin biosynthesis protein CobQ [Oscillospiraceae bacterium]